MVYCTDIIEEDSIVKIRDVVSGTQAANLLILKEYLESENLKIGFDMEDYENECGTVGCAAGQGPSAGIPKRADETWPAYVSRVFTDTSTSLVAWQYLFSDVWAQYDNTPEGAAVRIGCLLDNLDKDTEYLRGLLPWNRG